MQKQNNLNTMPASENIEEASAASNYALQDTQRLPAEQEQRAKEIAENITLSDPNLSTTYGTDTMRNISRFADTMLEQVKVKDSGQVGQTLSSLLGQVKEIDLRGIAGSKKGFLASLPVVGSLFNPVERYVNNFQTVSDQVEAIAGKLEDSMTGLLYDIEVLEQLYQHNKEFHEELSVYIAAGKMRLQKAREQELPALLAEAEKSDDSMSAQKVRDFSEQINRFERRLHDLQLSRTITLQTAPQIRLIQSNNQTLAEKIQTSVLSTIPIWKSQMVLALSIRGQQSAAQLQKSVADTTNSLLRNNAEVLQQSTIETARQVERSIVDVETVREVHGKLLATIEETLRIAQEGRQQRLETERELVAMEQDLKTKLTALASTKSQNVIDNAS